MKAIGKFSVLLPLLSVVAQAEDPVSGNNSAMANFTGTVKSSVLRDAAGLFVVDHRYCRPKGGSEASSSAKQCPLTTIASPQEDMGLFMTDGERALASAYRDVTFRHEVCESGHSPAPPNSPTYNTSDDGIELLKQLKRDDGDVDRKMSFLKNSPKWSASRFAQAKAKVHQWLLDWTWTESQHEAGAKWGATVCTKH